jgi:monoamine oxidase
VLKPQTSTADPTPDRRHAVVIVGAGLAGLHAAWQLTRRNVDFVLLEAADQPGGRIRTAHVDVADAGHFDLGPTWYWPAFQPRMQQLVQTLGLIPFEQPTSGDLVFEASPTQRQRVSQSFGAGSMRLQGGMGSLVAALLADIEPARLHCGQRVTALTLQAGGVRLDLAGASASLTSLMADRVLCTVPPRLLSDRVRFDPPLPAAVLASWSAVPTWMAAQAKFVAVYDRAFWRDDGLSGQAQSRVGPLVEVHDASAPDGLAALFGFVGLPARARRAAGDALPTSALAQLQRLFGQAAAHPVAWFLQDWATEPTLATEADAVGSASHPSYGQQLPPPAAWAQRLVLAGTEVARDQGGYLEGALEASDAAVATWALAAHGAPSP